VSTRLFLDDGGEDRAAWFGPGTLCSERPRGRDESPGRVADVAVRTALLTDVEVRVLPRDRPFIPR
jgi:hypothetical protein